ncbi:hypothetical protein Hden_1196 [Hyphomicrobium denitrificans ATCC 51888]|uniref:Uncharacterized protein n=1 Tax=Hyphomicrobium denitrificans (strain ATCC 51888 / DSM 1869 / NCIMB 11706 / TK 0415) TaxID=582899 RepID=D8JVX0_HYPDA|nr:hypothetical protein [Hyphomicrobium denitrificans]ADJ23009.1 hypothetical protein Hden_1196 [Hyphomicrobium denitrificans ATCC 51888]
MSYMIERRFGRFKRDWLLHFDPADAQPVFMLGAHRAALYASKAGAKKAAEICRQAARKWDNGADFEFVVIRDRRHMPNYFASIAA